jgi:hypothetical protein
MPQTLRADSTFVNPVVGSRDYCINEAAPTLPGDERALDDIVAGLAHVG